MAIYMTRAVAGAWDLSLCVVNFSAVMVHDLNTLAAVSRLSVCHVVKLLSGCSVHCLALSHVYWLL